MATTIAQRKCPVPGCTKMVVEERLDHAFWCGYFRSVCDACKAEGYAYTSGIGHKARLTLNDEDVPKGRFLEGERRNEAIKGLTW